MSESAERVRKASLLAALRAPLVFPPTSLRASEGSTTPSFARRAPPIYRANDQLGVKLWPRVAKGGWGEKLATLATLLF